jgi:signal transduction histidine kinase
MERRLAHRLVSFTIWGVLVVTVLVCGFGLRLTVQQYRDVEETLLAAEARAAESQVRRIEQDLAQRERAALESLAAARTDDKLRAVLAEHPFVELPFFVHSDGTLAAPHLRAASAASLVAEDPPPSEFRHAARMAFSPAPLAERLQRLEDVERSPVLAAPWRLRARNLAASLLLQSGDLVRAGETYRSIEVDFGPTLHAGIGPSFLHLALARAETLAQHLHGREAAAALLEACAELKAGKSSSSLDEEEFFVQRARAVFQALGAELPQDIAAEEARIALERAAVSTTERIRDLILAHAEAPPALSLPEREIRRLLLRMGDTLVPAVWMRLAPPDGSPGPIAVAFQHDVGRLTELLRAQLAPAVQGLPLDVRIEGAGGPAGFVSLAAFGGELGFAVAGMDRDAWKAAVGRARHPFFVAAVLVGALGLVLAASLLVLARAVRRELSLSRMKTEFVANVSHELKTPLALIRLCGETLELDRLPDQEHKRKYYQVIAREAERLTQLIENVLNFASIEAGRKSYRLLPCDLSGVVGRTLDHYRLPLEEKGFQLVQDLDAGLPPVLADEDAVAQALINLLQNAERYSTTTRRIEVTARANGSSVRVSVQDQGVGIAPAEQRRIWEDYYRTQEARSLGTRGSGLGLSVVQHVMRAHRGRVELESAPGAGSNFTLVFPVAVESLSEVRHESEDPGDRG